MGLIGGITKFGKGGVLGAAIGAAAAVLFAPGSGKETRDAIADRIQRTRRAGVEAKAEVERDLINRYRGNVSSGDALKAEQAASEQQYAASIAHIEATKPEF
ncbi:MAG: YtxH domain-containing protein [Thermomicrobiales bacterium]|nr:YtxH domain-containing protein [Thermomicrobiales bacterium]